MNRFFKKHFWLTAMVISVTAPAAYADDLFDDSFFADPAPVDAVKPADPAPAPEPAVEQTQNVSVPEPAQNEPALPETANAVLPPPAETAAQSAEPQLSMDFPAPTMDLNVPPPPSNTNAAQPSISGFDFGSSNAEASNFSTPPSEQILGRVSSDVFREMAEMERENSALMLQLKREKLRSEIDALKTSNRQMLFDEIERREKMTQARLEWELAQDLKRQEALERKQKAEIRQKQIEAALKREEDRRIQKMKDEEAARVQKEKEAAAEAERKKEELKKKYDAASMVQVNELKPVLMAATRPAKVKRSASSLVPAKLTAAGEDLLSKKKAGEALVTEVPVDENAEKAPVREPASALYAVAEIRGTAGTLIAKLISKKDRSTFFAKQSTILPSGHTVINIDKDFVMVQLGNDKEMIGFPSAGLLAEKIGGPNADGAIQDENQNASAEEGAAKASKRARRRRPTSNNKKGPLLVGAALAR
ncbi:MAG: hypothetical protein IJ752_03650 [Alphaproteobacteria bacterium]|nr:hypothetical protein [Alphaproteobacteria bacterium]